MVDARVLKEKTKGKLFAALGEFNSVQSIKSKFVKNREKCKDVINEVAKEISLNSMNAKKCESVLDSGMKVKPELDGASKVKPELGGVSKVEADLGGIIGWTGNRYTSFDQIANSEEWKLYQMQQSIKNEIKEREMLENRLSYWRDMYNEAGVFFINENFYDFFF